MTRIFTTSLIILCALSAMAQISADTIFRADTAEEIRIWSDNRYTDITVSRINGGPDNFYYRTGDGKHEGPWSQSKIVCPNVTNITVAETDSAVLVSYTSSQQSEEVSFRFPFSDPANRQQTSYIGRTSNDLGFNISRRGEAKWRVFFGGLSAGWVGTTGRTDGFSHGTSKSWDASILSLVGLKFSYRAHTLMTGFGLGGQHIVTKNDTYMERLPGGHIGLTPFADNQTKRSSTLELFRLQVPVLYSYSFGKNGDWKIAAGPVVNFNTGASIVTRYRMDGSDYTVKTGHLSKRLVTVDPLISFSYSGLGIYFRYSPMKQFHNSVGVNFNTWSAGIMLFLD